MQRARDGAASWQTMRASPGVDAADKLLHWVTEALLQVPIFARLRDEDAELPQRFASAAVAGGALAPPCAPAAKPRDWLSPWRDGSMLIVAEGAVEVMDCRTGRVLGALPPTTGSQLSQDYD